MFYSNITTQALKDLHSEIAEILLFLSFICLLFPIVSAGLVGWRATPSNQMRLAAQMRTNGFSNSDIIKHTALVFQTH